MVYKPFSYIFYLLFKQREKVKVEEGGGDNVASSSLVAAALVVVLSVVIIIVLYPITIHYYHPSSSSPLTIYVMNQGQHWKLAIIYICFMSGYYNNTISKQGN